MMERCIMTACDAVETMMRSTGRTAYRLARDVRRAPTYVSSMIRRRAEPAPSVLAMLGSACGYDLALVPRDGGESIIIDPRE